MRIYPTKVSLPPVFFSVSIVLPSELECCFTQDLAFLCQINMDELPGSSRALRRADDNIYLIGNVRNQIVGSKLPSNRQVMSVLFYNLRRVNINLRDSARLVIKEATVFWQKARIPTRDEQHCIGKLEKLYKSWRDLQKLSKRKTDTQNKKVEDFVNQLDNLFDIAHANALDIIHIEEDKLFLQSQRQKGRPGCMLGVDYKLSLQERKKEEKLKRFEDLKKRTYEEMKEAGTSSQTEFAITDSSSDENTPEIVMQGKEEEEEEEPKSPPLHRRRGSSNFITNKMLSALDRCKISDRDAIHLIIATVEALGIDVTKLIINRSSLQRLRKQFREEETKNIRDKFRLADMHSLVVHWDTKLLPEITERVKIDRLPVLVSFQGRAQLLGVPKLEAGTGKAQAEAVFDKLNEWGITDKVQAMCSDTTASNTGRISGACILLEELMDRDLLYLPCRRHILEIVLRSVFETKLKLTTSGPDVEFFKRFKEQWPSIDKANYDIGTNDTFVKTSVLNIQDHIIKFCLKCLENKQCRDDYREFLELVIIFLGAIPPRGVSFKFPGAFHHARWMSKAIYTLKIFLFRKQFSLTRGEEKAIRDITLFIIHLYVEAWFMCTFAVEAPYNDYMFLKKLVEYPDADVSRSALNKLCGHLWYISSETVALAFWDNRLPKEIKGKMVKAMNTIDQVEEMNDKRVLVRPNEVKDLFNNDISQFVNSNTQKFFKKFNICTDFLTVSCDQWETRDDYKYGLQIINNLSVINDVAERGVKLIEEYNTILTKDEKQKQFLLQVVNDYRAKYPDHRKQTLQDI